MVNPNGKPNESPFLSAKSRTVLYLVKNPIIVSHIGEYKKGSDNISTISTRFGIMKDILSLNSIGSNEGSERGAFRHAAWQAIMGQLKPKRQQMQMKKTLIQIKT